MPHARSIALRAAVVTGLGTVLFVGPAGAHAGALRTVTEPGPVPLWLVLLTGGGVITVSFLVASLVTDRDDIDAVHEWGLRLPAVGDTVVRATRIASVVVLVAVVASGLFGPQSPTANLAVLVVWVGWWAGYTMSVYLVGNTWSALNPWRAIAGLLPERRRPYPERLGAWPAVVGLLALVWVEVITPVAEVPWLLSVVVLAYTAITLAGAVVYGTDVWFSTVDPVSRVFRAYGRVAPLQRTEDGIEVRVPGAALKESGVDGVDEVAFLLALLWATTYDGFISTSGWAAVVRPVVGVGVPPLVAYLATIVAGFGLFLGVYRAASRLSRRTADSYVAVRAIGERFAPSLLPIAAGYHLAHFLGYFLTLVPALAAAVASPLGAPPGVEVLVLPDWFGVVGLVAVLLGHLIAIWVAHATSFDLFAGRLQPIRSQYPYIVVMIFYTMTSMWIVTQPYTPPPFL